VNNTLPDTPSTDNDEKASCENNTEKQVPIVVVNSNGDVKETIKKDDGKMRPKKKC
jgi:uncharacterized protein GlcG (DUF336 family)